MTEYIPLFPFASYWWLYGLFILLVMVILALDLGVFHKECHVVTFKEAAAWSVVWVILALCFAWGLYEYASWRFPQDERLIAAGIDFGQKSKQVTLEYLTGYVVEKSLAVDNIFVFVVIFNFLAIPAKYQHRVLFFGIIGAVIFRILFIALGSVLMEYKAIVIFFGVLLILTGIKILFAPEKQNDDLSQSWIYKTLRKFIPFSPNLDGQNFFTKLNGKLHATPLFVALIFIEVSDIIFAVDSVPAIFAITKEPFIVFTSNMFAILGLRSMFFMLADLVHRFAYLKYGLGIILVFVGLKMIWLNDAFGGKFPISWSLGIIISILTISITVSLIKTKKTETPSS